MTCSKRSSMFSARSTSNFHSTDRIPKVEVNRNLFNVKAIVAVLGILFISSGCLRYSFTGVSIPSDVSTIYIPFFADNSGSGLSDLSDQLNAALINRFVNNTRLLLVNSEDQADIVLNGTISGYSNQPFSVSGDQTASLNRVQITVNGTFLYTRDEDPLWNRSFTGQAEYDPTVNPLEGEVSAATEAMDRIAQNMFNDSVGRW